jgi:hypothetical protein
MGSERQSKATLLANLAMQTKSPQLLRPILKMADIPEADAIADQVDQVNQLSQQAKGLEDQVTRLEQMNQQLQNQIVQKSQQVELSQFREALDGIVNKIESGLSIKMANELSKFKEGLMLQKINTANKESS